MASSKRPRRPGDFTQRAKLVVDLSTGQITQDEIDALPPMGREISAQARNEAVSPERRREIARKGGLASQAKARKAAAKLVT